MTELDIGITGPESFNTIFESLNHGQLFYHSCMQ